MKKWTVFAPSGQGEWTSYVSESDAWGLAHDGWEQYRLLHKWSELTSEAKFQWIDGRECRAWKCVLAEGSEPSTPAQAVDRFKKAAAQVRADATQLFEERDAAIKERDTAIRQRDEVIAERDSARKRLAHTADVLKELREILGASDSESIQVAAKRVARDLQFVRCESERLFKARNDLGDKLSASEKESAARSKLLDDVRQELRERDADVGHWIMRHDELGRKLDLVTQELHKHRNELAASEKENQRERGIWSKCYEILKDKAPGQTYSIDELIPLCEHYREIAVQREVLMENRVDLLRNLATSGYHCPECAIKSPLIGNCTCPWGPWRLPKPEEKK